MIVLDLPLPPTVNALWINLPGRGRVRSKVYRKWAKQAGWELVCQRPGQHQGAFIVDVALPATARGDRDNYTKPLLDLLVTHKVIEDDGPEYVKAVTAYARDADQFPGVRLVVRPV